MFKLNSKKEVNQNLKKLKQKKEKILVIHYACESFYDLKNGKTPRINSIAIQNFSNRLTEIFSISKIAEIKGYNSKDIENHYDKLEKEILNEYFNYIKDKLKDHIFVHWNMKNGQYGFQALEHRCKTLKGEIITIPDNNKIGLSHSLLILFGENYVPDEPSGRLLNIAIKNGLNTENFLPGKEEAQAFKKKEYNKIDQSILRKVEVISSILYNLLEGKLKTDSKYYSIKELCKYLLGIFFTYIIYRILDFTYDDFF